MSETNWDELLSQQASDFQPPVPLPRGTYSGTIQPAPEFGESKNKKTPYVRFEIKDIVPGSDVDPILLEGVDLVDRSIRTDSFYFSPKALYRLTGFLGAAGLNTDRPFDQIIPESAGRRINFFVIQTPSGREGDSSMFNEITSYSEVEG